MSRTVLVVKSGSGMSLQLSGSVTGGEAAITAYSSKLDGPTGAAHVFLEVSLGASHEYIVRLVEETDPTLDREGTIILRSRDNVLVVVEPVNNA
jgi:hypothetical protein